MPTIQQDFVTKWAFTPSARKDFTAQFAVYKKFDTKDFTAQFDVYEEVRQSNSFTFRLYNYVPNILFNTQWDIKPWALNSLTTSFKLTNTVYNRLGIRFSVTRGNHIISSFSTSYKTYNRIDRSLTASYGMYTNLVYQNFTTLFGAHSGVANSLTIAYGMTPVRSELGSAHIPMISPNRIYIV